MIWSVVSSKFRAELNVAGDGLSYFTIFTG